MHIGETLTRDNLLSLIGGPLVWVVHFLGIYILTAVACAHDFFQAELLGIRVVPLVGGALTLLAVIVILDGGSVAWRRWRDRPGGELPPHDGPDVASRRRFMAYAGLLLTGISFLAVIWETIPILIFDTCR